MQKSPTFSQGPCTLPTQPSTHSHQHTALSTKPSPYSLFRENTLHSLHTWQGSFTKIGRALLRKYRALLHSCKSLNPKPLSPGFSPHAALDCLHTQPCILCIQPSISPHIPLHPTKRALYSIQKSPVFYQKSPEFSLQSPAFSPHSNLSTQQSLHTAL